CAMGGRSGGYKPVNGPASHTLGFREVEILPGFCGPCVQAEVWVAHRVNGQQVRILGFRWLDDWRFPFEAAIAKPKNELADDRLCPFLLECGLDPLAAHLAF